MRYSGFRVIAEALTGHKGWKPAWRDPEPQAAYDYIIIGGGGHGLATAYYLAKEFRQARIAVLERAISAAATWAATPPSSAPTICWMATNPSTNSR